MSEPSKEPLTREEMQGYLAALKEESLPSKAHDEESKHAKEIALPGAASISAVTRLSKPVLCSAG